MLCDGPISSGSDMGKFLEKHNLVTIGLSLRTITDVSFQIIDFSIGLFPTARSPALEIVPKFLDHFSLPISKYNWTRTIIDAAKKIYQFYIPLRL
jgi:hypothetical protein